MTPIRKDPNKIDGGVCFENFFVEFEKRFLESQRAQDAAVQTMKTELESKASAALSAQDRAVLVAQGEMNRRLDSMNEFRGQLKDQTATFVTRAVYEAQVLRHDDEHKALDKKIAEGLSTEVYRSEHASLSKRVDELIQWKAERESTFVVVNNLAEQVRKLDTWKSEKEATISQVGTNTIRLDKLENWQTSREGSLQLVKDVANKVDDLEKWKANQEGASSRYNVLMQRANWISVVAALISLFAILLHFMKP